MKKIALIIAISSIALSLSLSESSAASIPTHAVNNDYASFESFYKEDLSLTSWVLAGVLAVAGVVAVFFTMGAAAPGVAAIGASIGSAMGLSGAAATSAGLAWLGGGALAAGGFGMVGGAALLTAVFEASIVGGTQYYQHYMNKKLYTELCEAVKDYPTLPPILNSTGPEEVEEIVVLLKENYDINQVPSFLGNINTVNVAISKTHRYSPESDSFYKIGYDTVIRREKLRIYTLQSILYFMNNDYREAYSSAEKAATYHTAEDGPRSVIDFVLSVSGVMTSQIGIVSSINYFRNAILDEDDNQLTPLLLSIYLSRIGALNMADSSFLKDIYSITRNIKNDKIKSVVTSQIITASLAKIWEHQQNIQSIYDNIEMLEHNLAVNNSKKSFDECKLLLDFTNSMIVLNRFSNDDSSDEMRGFYLKSSNSLDKYAQNNKNFEDMIEKIESYQIDDSDNENNIISIQKRDMVSDAPDIDTKQNINKTELQSTAVPTQEKYQLGLKYESLSRDGHISTYSEIAFFWFEEAAKEEHADAQAKLGECYEYGKGVDKDIHKAAYWYLKAANSGSSFASDRLQDIAK